MRAKSAALFLTVLALSACAAPTPQLGRGLPRNFASADRAFDERMRARFPVGSPEALLRNELALERFKIVAAPTGAASTYQFIAIHGGQSGIACDLTWTVMWSADGGVIAKIAASYYATCL